MIPIQRMKRILHRRRSSANSENHVTLSLHRNDFQSLATHNGVPPYKTGILLKYTNVLKRWKPRSFILENGLLLYSAPAGEENDSPSSSAKNIKSLQKDKLKKKRSKKLHFLRRAVSRDEKEKEFKGSINLQTAVITPDHSDTCRFAIDVGQEIYHCKAESTAERDEWVRVLNASNSYFRSLIRRALSRSTNTLPESHGDATNSTNKLPQAQQLSPTTVSKPLGTDLNQNNSDESEDSVLEDDGLKEAEQSRRALMLELTRILTIWKAKLIPEDHATVSGEKLVRILSDTFRDLGTQNQTVSNDPVRETVRGLIDLTAWCLNVLQTNDGMFDRRLKADITRLMANGLPVFPKSPSEQTPRMATQIADDEDSSEEEFVDALSRVASVRSSLRLQELLKPHRFPKVGNKPPTEIQASLSQNRKVAGEFGLIPNPEISSGTDDREPSAKNSHGNICFGQRVSTVILSSSLKGGRSCLPSLPENMEKPNVWSILKDAVGKDLSKISIPLTLNEPISFVQRLAEDIEYCELLDKGACETDPNRRLMYVAAMVISHYSSTQGRVAKPFNPLLGETACVVQPEKGKGVRFVAEQVSHHPPISACYAEGSGASWKYHNAIELKNKFWGKSLEIFPTGMNHIEFPETGDHYVYEQVTSCVHNVVIGRMWLDNYGEMEIVNKTNGGRCVIDFKKTGWMSDAKSFGCIEATIFDASGSPKIKLGGNWTNVVYEDLGRGRKNIIWEVQERPPQECSQTYNFTGWGINLNTPVHEDEDKFIAPTDSRRRPDQRALEDGEYDLGSRLKGVLEEGQRERRKEMETDGRKWEPLWFEKAYDETTNSMDYRYKGSFFERQIAGNWDGCTDIFSCAKDEKQ